MSTTLEKSDLRGHAFQMLSDSGAMDELWIGLGEMYQQDMFEGATEGWIRFKQNLLLPDDYLRF